MHSEYILLKDHVVGITCPKCAGKPPPFLPALAVEQKLASSGMSEHIGGWLCCIPSSSLQKASMKVIPALGIPSSAILMPWACFGFNHGFKFIVKCK